MMSLDGTSVHVTSLQRWQRWAAKGSIAMRRKTRATAGKPKDMLAFHPAKQSDAWFWEKGGAKSVTATTDHNR